MTPGSGCAKPQIGASAAPGSSKSISRTDTPLTLRTVLEVPADNRELVQPSDRKEPFSGLLAVVRRKHADLCRLRSVTTEPLLWLAIERTRAHMETALYYLEDASEQVSLMEADANLCANCGERFTEQKFCGQCA